MRKLLMLAVVLLLLVPMLFSQDRRIEPEAYTAVAMGTGGRVGASAIPFDFRITSYATDEEVDRLATLLKEKGQDDLRLALEKLDAGRINPVGSVGNTIAIARKRRQGSTTIITIITARYMSFGELTRSSRSIDYPFGFLRVTLNEKGEGTGKIIGAAKLRFDKKKGHYEIESYGNQYVKAANVRPNK